MKGNYFVIDRLGDNFSATLYNHLGYDGVIMWANVCNLFSTAANSVKSKIINAPAVPEAVKDGGVVVGAGAIGGVAATTAATAGLSAVGFGSSGIVGGSIAAGVQAGIGNVAAGSLFATLQSVGATGGFALLGPVGIVGAAVAAATVGTVAYVKRRNRPNMTGTPTGTVKYEKLSDSLKPVDPCQCDLCQELDETKTPSSVHQDHESEGESSDEATDEYLADIMYAIGKK